MPHMTYQEKLAQVNKEAKITLVALGIIVVAWIVLGFGLSACDIEIANTPIWVIGGTLGIWLVAIAVSIILPKFFFKDFPLDDEEDQEEANSE